MLKAAPNELPIREPRLNSVNKINILKNIYLVFIKLTRFSLGLADEAEKDKSYDDLVRESHGCFLNCVSLCWNAMLQ